MVGVDDDELVLEDGVAAGNSPQDVPPANVALGLEIVEPRTVGAGRLQTGGFKLAGDVIRRRARAWRVVFAALERVGSEEFDVLAQPGHPCIGILRRKRARMD